MRNFIKREGEGKSVPFKGPRTSVDLDEILDIQPFGFRIVRKEESPLSFGSLAAVSATRRVMVAVISCGDTGDVSSDQYEKQKRLASAVSGNGPVRPLAVCRPMSGSGLHP